MSNSYYKIISTSVNKKFKDDIINALQDNLRNFAKLQNEDMYDFVNANKISNEKDVNLLLKYYILNQITQETSKINKSKATLQDTANKNIKKDTSNNYYKLTNGRYQQDSTIKEVFEDGSYLVETMLNKHSQYTIRKMFDINDKITRIQLINPTGQVETNLRFVLEILEMRKEFVEKYKYSGYSGNSNDFIATILNKFNAPVATGYYMDKHYNLYKWDTMSNCLVHNPNKDVQSPLLTDYSFLKAKEVIRKEYTGV